MKKNPFIMVLEGNNMKLKFEIAICSLFFCMPFLNRTLYAQDLPFIRDTSIRVSTSFDSTTMTFFYSYTIFNSALSDGDLDRVEIDISRSSSEVDFDTLGLRFSGSFVEGYFHRNYPSLAGEIVPVGFPQLPPYWIGGITVAATASIWGQSIEPGDSLTGVSINSKGLPGMRGFTAAPGDISDLFPSVDDVENPDSLSAVVDSAREVVKFYGVTIGPTAPPAEFDSVAFVDTLLSYTNQSRTLEWITSQTTADKYIGYFDSTKYYLQQSNIAAALAVLQQVLTDAEMDKTSTLTSEAYALIRFNTEYLIERLPEN